MIAAESAISVRQATTEDLAGLVYLLTPLEEQGSLVPRSRDRLEKDLANFVVVEQDNRIIGSAALIPISESCAELAALAVDPSKAQQTIGTQLMTHLESKAHGLGIDTLFVLTTQASDWFIEKGFVEVEVDALPEDRKIFYNYQRNARILKKLLRE